MDEVRFARDQENEAYGFFLIAAVAKRYGVEPDVKRIERAVYKGTDCGAWIKFDALGIMVGTIVEGSDAEHAERIPLDGIDTDEAGEEEIADRVAAALRRCEKFSDEVWSEKEV